MKRTLTVLLAMLLAVGMLASFAGPVVAQDDGDETDTTVCTIEAPDTAIESAETSLCEPESPDDNPSIQYNDVEQD